MKDSRQSDMHTVYLQFPNHKATVRIDDEALEVLCGPPGPWIVVKCAITSTVMHVNTSQVSYWSRDA